VRRGKGGTRRKLLNAAEKILGKRGYNGASVSAICHQAGVAQGTFYRYFRNKEEIYLELVLLLEKFLRGKLLRAVSLENEPDRRLWAAFRALLHGIEKRSRLYQIFREAEFVRMEIPKRFYSDLASIFREVLHQGVEGGFFRPLDPETVSFGILGIAEFIAMRYLLWKNSKIGPEALSTAKELVFEGIDLDEKHYLIQEVELPGDNKEESLEGGEATRKALLRAAERLFGQAGFHKTTVAEITYVAGVAQGTFYLYFPSKTDIFVALVQEINRELRWATRTAISGVSDRRDAECLGFQAFFKFISRHPEAYRIVREAEFVDKGLGRWYYQRLAGAYARELGKAMERGEIRLMAPEPLAYALLGIGHFIGLRWIVWEHRERLPEAVLRDTLDFILHGIRGGGA